MTRSKRAAAAAAASKIKKVVEVFNIDENTEFPPRKKARHFHQEDKPKEKTSKAHSRSAEWLEPDTSKLPPPSDSSLCSEDATVAGSTISGNSIFSWKEDDSMELTSTQKEHFLHLQRCARRSVNSTGPMFLSNRSRFRMSLDSIASPMLSPIQALRLRFTPVAHLKVTPIGKPGSSKFPQ